MKKLAFIFSVLIMLTACSSSDPYDPSKEPTTVTFSLVSDDSVNPNIWGESAPLEIQVFELEDDSMFMSADFDQLNDTYKQVLRSNYVESYDYVLSPKQFKFVDAFEIDEDTNYIGVMARFSDPDASEWKKSVKVLNKGRKYHLLMKFDDYSVWLEKVE